MAASGCVGLWPRARQPIWGGGSRLRRRPSAQSARWARGQRRQKSGRENLGASAPWKSAGLCGWTSPCRVSRLPAPFAATLGRQGACGRVMCFINSIQRPRSRLRRPPGPAPPARASPAGCRPRIQRGRTGRTTPGRETSWLFFPLAPPETLSRPSCACAPADSEGPPAAWHTWGSRPRIFMPESRKTQVSCREQRSVP